MRIPEILQRNGMGIDAWRRLTGRLYEADPEDTGKDAEKAPEKDDAGKKKAAAAPEPKKEVPIPSRTQGAPDRTRKDPGPGGKTLQTQLQQMAAELKKKYGLPRDPEDRPLPPPPALNAPAAMGPAVKK